MSPLDTLIAGLRVRATPQPEPQPQAKAQPGQASAQGQPAILGINAPQPVQLAPFAQEFLDPYQARLEKPKAQAGAQQGQQGPVDILGFLATLSSFMGGR